MAQPVREDITNSWRALADSHQSTGWRSICLSSGACKLHAARYFPDNAEALLIGFETLVLPHTSQLPQGNGFRVERISNNATELDGKWVALIRQPQGGLEIFAQMVSDVVTTLADCRLSDEHQLFNLFLGRIRAWQRFMMKDNEGLSPEAELGLVGELQCLKLLLEARIPPHIALEGWIGPLDRVQDFELGHGAIEVKSTLSREGFIAQIFSLEQLDDAERQPLFVCGCRFTIDASGKSLAHRVNEMRAIFASDALLQEVFENHLLNAGFLNIHSSQYTRAFLLSEANFRIVDAGFPRLTVGNVPAGIKRVKYEIDLDSIATNVVPIDSVIQQLGVI